MLSSVGDSSVIYGFRECKKFGTTAWMVCIIIFTEILIIFKFGWETVMLPFPFHVRAGWVGGFTILLLWTIWHFYLQRLLWHTEGKLPRGNPETPDPSMQQEQQQEKTSAVQNNNFAAVTMNRKIRYRGADGDGPQENGVVGGCDPVHAKAH